MSKQVSRQRCWSRAAGLQAASDALAPSAWLGQAAVPDGQAAACTQLPGALHEGLGPLIPAG